MLTNADRELVARGAQTTRSPTHSAPAILRKSGSPTPRRQRPMPTRPRSTRRPSPACKAHCASMLLAAQNTANTELAAARAAYAQQRSPKSPTALATNLGVEQWQWDLFIAALRSGMIAAGALALGIAIHPSKKATAAAADAVTLTRKEMPARPVSQAVTTLARPMNRREHVSQFLSAVIRSDESSGASLRALHSKYAAWSPSQKPKKRDAPGGSAFYVPGKYSPQPGHRQAGSYELSHTTRRLDALPAGRGPERGRMAPMLASMQARVASR